MGRSMLRPYTDKAARLGRRPLQRKLRAIVLENIAGLEQSMQDGFLHVHAVFGLIENDRLGAVEDFRSDFQARCAGRQCMNTASDAASDISSVLT